MTKQLKISPTLSLPADAATSTLVVYGGKGMGKTNLASVLVEEFDGAGIRFALLDPMGVSWGLRHGENGKGNGIEVLILGGVHGDMPIEPTSGAVVADLVVDEDVSVIIDISRRADGSMWSIADRVRFVTAFAKRLYQRQGEKRRPLNLVIDEAARFAPQVVRHGESDLAACIGAIAVLVEEGRNVGIGVTLVTQRSARLNKDVAELADCMFAFRTVGPNSMRAVLDWLGEHVEKSRLKELGEKLRSLPRGSALVVSPGWLEYEGIVAIRKRETFDSSATPKAGASVRVTGQGAKPDLAKYQARMAEVIQQASANDPKILKAKLAELEHKLTKAHQVIDSKIAVAKAEPQIVEREVLTTAALARLQTAIVDVTTLRDRTSILAGELGDAVQALDRALENTSTIFAGVSLGMPRPGAKPQFSSSGKEAIHGAAGPVRSAASDKGVRRSAGAGERRLPGVTAGETASIGHRHRDVKPSNATGVTAPQQRILNALAVLEQIGHAPADKTQTALFANASPKSSSYTNNIGALRTAGLIEYPGPGSVQLTDTGRTRADASDAPSTVEEMHDYVRELVGTPRWRLLTELIRVYPHALDKGELARRANASATSSSFTNNLGSLRTLGLIDYPQPGSARAEPVLFLEATR